MTRFLSKDIQIELDIFSTPPGPASSLETLHERVEVLFESPEADSDPLASSLGWQLTPPAAPAQPPAKLSVTDRIGLFFASNHNPTTIGPRASARPTCLKVYPYPIPKNHDRVGLLAK